MKIKEDSCISQLLLLLLLLCMVPNSQEKIGKNAGIIKKQGWQPHCPVTCICHLTSVYCDAMGLRRLPRPFPDNTQAIYLRDNYIRRVPFKRLRGLTNLKHLLMKGNRIVEVEGHAFKHLVKLISLSLTDNLLSYLSPKLFQNQANLQVLSVRNNKLRHVKGLFHNLKKLQLLNLANNRIRYISHDMFHTTPLLRVIDLHNNRIKHIPWDTFTRLPFLRFLVLRDNDLGYIRFRFAKTIHLELLDLTNCGLKQLAEGLPSTINDLRLSENHITELDEHAFNTTKEIRLLVLNHNEIKKIHRKAFSTLTQLYDLYIGKNKLTQIPYGLPKNIHGLYANFNNITSIGEATFNYHSKLEFLFLRNNNLQKIEQTAFHGLHNLRSLDLSRNNIMGLKPYSFSRMRSLELLDLSKNPIAELQYGCFHGLYKLTILQLSSVATKSLITASTFRDMESLRFLDLSNSAPLVQKMAKNRVTFKAFKSVEDLNMMNDLLNRLPPDFPNHFPLLRVVKLIGNPWHCDQSIIWLTQWMRNRTISFYAPHYMTCASPPKLAGKQLNLLRRDEIIKANKPTPKPKPKPKPGHGFTKNIRVDSVSLISKVVDSPKKTVTKGSKVKFQGKRQGLSNSIIKVTPGNNINMISYNNSNNIMPTIKVTPHKYLKVDKDHNEVEKDQNEVVVKVTPVKLIHNEGSHGDDDDEIDMLPKDDSDHYDSNKHFNKIPTVATPMENDEANTTMVENNEEKFNVISNIPEDISKVPDVNSNKIDRVINNKSDEKTEHKDGHPVAEDNKHQYGNRSGRRIQSKLPKSWFMSQYKPSKQRPSQVSYSDRVFENVEQAEKFLLQTYTSTLKRSYHGYPEKKSNKQNSVLFNSQYRTAGPPLYDDSSGFIDEEN